MNQTENNAQENDNGKGADNVKNVLSSLGESANNVSNFLNILQNSLTPEQKSEIDKQLGSNNAFQEQMRKVQTDLTKAMVDIKNHKYGI